MGELLVAIPDGMDKSAVDYLTKQGMTVIPKNESQKMGIESLLRETDAIVARSATKVNGLSNEPRVKIFGRNGSGIDNFEKGSGQIQAAGIPIVNSPEPNSISVAELVMAFIFHDVRNLVPVFEASKKGVWSKDPQEKDNYPKYHGGRAYGKTIGIIGCGLIGREVAKRADACGMNILAYDIIPNKMLPYIKFVGLNELLRNSDYVTLHPSDKKQILGKQELELTKKGVVIINAARGGIVNEADIVDALDSGHVRRAYIDTFTAEPFDGREGKPKPSPELIKLLDHPNAYCTAHLGAESEEGQRDGSMIIARRMANYLQHGFLDVLCNPNMDKGRYIDISLNGSRSVFHKAGMFIGQYSQGEIERVSVALGGELRTLSDSSRNQLLNSLMTGLFFSRGIYVNPLNLESVVGNTQRSISNEDNRHDSTFKVEVQGRDLTYRMEVDYKTGELIGLGNGTKNDGGGYFPARIGLNGNLVILEHDDSPGALSILADRFGKEGINISNATTKKGNGHALTVFELETALNGGIVSKLLGDSPYEYGGHQVRLHGGYSFKLPPQNALNNVGKLGH